MYVIAHLSVWNNGSNRNAVSCNNDRHIGANQYLRAGKDVVKPVSTQVRMR